MVNHGGQSKKSKREEYDELNGKKNGNVRIEGEGTITACTEEGFLKLILKLEISEEM